MLFKYTVGMLNAPTKIALIFAAMVFLGGCGKREMPTAQASAPMTDWRVDTGYRPYSTSCFKGLRMITNNGASFYELNKDGKPVACL